LVAFAQVVHREAADAQEGLLKYGPVLADNAPIEKTRTSCGEIYKHLNWRQASARSSSGNAKRGPIRCDHVRQTRAAAPAEHFDALRRLARLKILRRDLGLRWDRQVAPLGASSSSKWEMEWRTLSSSSAILFEIAEWRELVWVPLEEELKNLGFCWEKFIAEQPVCVGAYGELARIERAVTNSLLTILTLDCTSSSISASIRSSTR